MNQRTKRNVISLAGLAVFAGLALGSTDQGQKGSYSSGDNSSTSNRSLSSSQQSSPKQTILSSVKLDVRPSKAGFGNIMEADFTISNPTEYGFKDFEITCTHYAKSGTEIDSNTRTIYEVIPAKSKKTIKDFNMGFIHSQANTTSCKLTDLTVL